MSRKDNIDILGDPWKLLDDSEKAQIEESAKSDSELAADLEFAKSLSAMTAAELVGEPPTSDSVFLVNLREKLEPKAETVRTSAWTGLRLWLTTATASILLFVGIYLGGEQSGSPEMAQSQGATIGWYDGIEELDELDEVTIADYLSLDLEEDSDLLDFDSETDQPVTDQILELDNESLDDILSEIESLTFFANAEYADEG